MSEQSFGDWYAAMRTELAPYLAGTVQEAWDRCEPIWRERGRIEDGRRETGIHRPHYEPWWGRYLAMEFTQKFRDDYQFLIPFLTSEDEFLRIAAVELLVHL